MPIGKTNHKTSQFPQLPSQSPLSGSPLPPRAPQGGVQVPTDISRVSSGHLARSRQTLLVISDTELTGTPWEKEGRRGGQADAANQSERTGFSWKRFQAVLPPLEGSAPPHPSCSFSF